MRRWIEVLHAQTMRRLEVRGRLPGCLARRLGLFRPGLQRPPDVLPAYLHEHGVFHRLAEICDLYHTNGLKMIFHSDGYIRPIVPDLIAAGVDALAPIETSAGLNWRI